MLIERVDTYTLRAGLGEGGFYSSQGRFDARTSLLVRITTNDGLTGWGEAGVSMPVDHVATYIHDIAAPRILGRDASATEPIWHDLYAFSRDFGRGATPIDALSGIDIALWDIRGRAAKAPIHALMGGAFRTAVRAYATGLYYSADLIDRGRDDEGLIREQVAEYTARGFSAIKGKIGLLSVSEDARRMEVARDAAGDDALLMTDANHGYNRNTALEMGRVLEALGFHWYEEPVVPEDVEGAADLCRRLDIPIAAGECEYTRHGMQRLLAAGAADILQPDLAACGGLSEGQKIAVLASAWHTPVCPHVWGTGVAIAAALQFAATLPPTPHTAIPRAPENEPLFEYDCSPNPLRDELVAGGFPLETGTLAVPDGPGLGIEIDTDALEHYAIAHRSTTQGA